MDLFKKNNFKWQKALLYSLIIGFSFGITSLFCFIFIEEYGFQFVVSGIIQGLLVGTIFGIPQKNRKKMIALIFGCIYSFSSAGILLATFFRWSRWDMDIVIFIIFTSYFQYSKVDVILKEKEDASIVAGLGTFVAVLITLLIVSIRHNDNLYTALIPLVKTIYININLSEAFPLAYALVSICGGMSFAFALSYFLQIEGKKG